MDETSTGLDSSTTYQIVKCLQQIVHLGEATILMSLLQPEPETFKLFDDIILLSEGQIVYQGPREYILDFFESCGFCCPERKSIADFLQEIISRKDQAQYWADHTRPYRYITAYEFADLFNQFHIGLHLKTELSVPFDKSRNHQAALVFKKHVVPFSELLAASFTKEWLFIKRNLFLYLFKPIQEHGKSLGLEVLENINVFPEKNWYWIGVCGLAGFAIFFNVLYTLALAYLRPLDIPQAVISEAMASNLDANIEKRETSRSMKVDAVNCSSPPAFPTNDEDKNREMVDLQKGHSSESVDVLNSRASFDVLRSHLPKRGMVLPFTPLIMTFHDVNYYINNPTEIKNQGETVDRIQLLNDITGAFRSGVLTALMGMSGAGKTTLMDVLAGRKNVGYIKGDIRISGYPKNQATFTRVLGYCEQSDIHSPQITVNESLIYSAFLRLPMNVNNEEKMKFVDEVMELVELTNIKDAIVGLPGVSGLSTEQRKRLTIAVELVANPSIIFMDEPTTGLDARASAIVMRAVRNIVDTGRTIVCTIHQPSIDIFESFDELLLLKRGQIIYSGSLGRNSQKMIEYFKDIPGVPKIKENQNPATWMLAITSNGATDFAEYYQSSYLYQRNRELVNNLSKPVMESEDLYFPSKYSQTIYAQFRICLWKHWWTYWRTPRYNLVRLLFTCVTSIILGSTFWRIGRRREDANDLRIVIGSMLIASQFIGITNCSTVQPVVATERIVFYRERAAGMYSAVPYAIAQVVVEIPYVLLQSLQFSVVIYSMMSFQWTAEKFFWFFFISFFSFLYFTYYGMMTVSISPNHQVAAILSSTFYSVFSLFAGFYIPKPRIAKAWIWYYWICPLAWTVYGLIVSQFGDVEDIIRVPGQADQPIKLYVKEHFGYDRDLLGVVGVVLVSFCVFFAFTFAFCIRALNFQRR